MFKKIVFIIFTIWILTETNLAVDSNESIVCEAPWRSLHHSCIFFMSMNFKSNWRDARDICYSMNSDLLSIVNEQELENISPLLQSYVNVSILKWWIGLNKTNGDWTWIHNNASYTEIPNWAPDAQWNSTQPLEQCGLIEYQGTLKNRNCNVSHHFICEQNKTTYWTTESLSSPTTIVVPSSSVISTTYAVPTPDTRTPTTKGERSTSATTVVSSTLTNTKSTSITAENTTQISTLPTDTTTESTRSTVSQTTKESTQKTDTRTTKEPVQPTVTQTSQESTRSTDSQTTEESTRITDTQTTEESTRSTDTQTSQESTRSTDSQTSQESTRITDTQTTEESTRITDTQTTEESTRITDTRTTEESTRITDTRTTKEPIRSTVTRTTDSNIGSSSSTVVQQTETSSVVTISRNPSETTSSYSSGKESTDSTSTYTHEFTNTSFTSEQTTQHTSTESQVNEQDLFRGCFSINYENNCPPVVAYGLSWPRSAPGTMVRVSCRTGFAKWKCDKNPTCWKGEPDVRQCTSENIQELTNQMEEFMANTSNLEVALEFTENLAATVDTVMTEQDIFQSTKLLMAISYTNTNNTVGVKSIIQNVARFGSGLVGKTDTWTAMNPDSQRSIASSLLTSMESVTNNMIQSFNEPMMETMQEDNVEIQLQVIDVAQDGTKVNDTFSKTDNSNFEIPQENLKRFTTGGMARLVFINYNFVGKYLAPTSNLAKDKIERRIISEVTSVSISEKPANEPLVKPVVFTMKVKKTKTNQNITQFCSFWNFSLGHTGAWSQEGCSLKESNDTHVTCQCDHLTNFAILMDVHSTKVTTVHSIVLSYITYVGIVISLVCLLLSWITFVCLSIRCIRGSRSSYGYGDGKEYYGNSGSYSGSSASSRSIQGERNSIHKNLIFCLFIAEVVFLFGIERTDNKVACAIIAGFLHYFFLSSFAWMFAEGIHIVFMLVQVFDSARSRLKYYYMIGYGAPILVISISALVYYEGYGTEKYCWLTSDRMFIWSFAGPVIFILVVNLIIQIYAMYAVCKHSEYVFTKEKSKVGNIKAWIQGALAMEILLGLTWVFGYFYITEEAIPVAYLFTIFNSLQGLFIFVFHCLLNKKVRKAYTRFIDYPGRSTASGTHSPNTYPHNGAAPTSSSYHMTRKHSKFLDLTKDRRPSNMSTTSA